MINPYYDDFLEYGDAQYFYSLNRNDIRTELVRKYAWAIPNEDTLCTIAQYAPRIVEIGAGTGYWAYMLAQTGVNSICYDRAPYENKYASNNWYPIMRGGPVKAAHHADRALFLCWPPYAEPMAYYALKAYKGDTVIYIGEGHGGCTGDDNFHYLLGDNSPWDEPIFESPWECVETLWLPQWRGIHDSVYIYHRK